MSHGYNKSAKNSTERCFILTELNNAQITNCFYNSIIYGTLIALFTVAIYYAV
jgi:hypothetical protein